MKFKETRKIGIACLATLLISGSVLFSEEPGAKSALDATTGGPGATAAVVLDSAAVPLGTPSEPIEPVRAAIPSLDTCAAGEVKANPTRPVWDNGASTTQCGVLESDFGWLWQPMGAGVSQRAFASSSRYGLTSRMDLRWGMVNRVSQSGGGGAALEGIGDQWVSARFRFIEQGRWLPAMAVGYGIKIPTANPHKGFGTGFTDHQFSWLVSRDLPWRNHLDFNVVGTLAGEALPGAVGHGLTGHDVTGHDGAAQFGMVLTRPISGRLNWMLESYGGSQPGVGDRLGVVLTAANYSLRPWLVLDAAYARTFTAGSPRQQVLLGVTYAVRPRFNPPGHSFRSGRRLGR